MVPTAGHLCLVSISPQSPKPSTRETSYDIRGKRHAAFASCKQRAAGRAIWAVLTRSYILDLSACSQAILTQSHRRSKSSPLGELVICESFA